MSELENEYASHRYLCFHLAPHSALLALSQILANPYASRSLAHSGGPLFSP